MTLLEPTDHAGGEMSEDLGNEIEAVNSIFGPDTLVRTYPSLISTAALSHDSSSSSLSSSSSSVPSSSSSAILLVLTPPSRAVSLLCAFPRDYPSPSPSPSSSSSSSCSSGGPPWVVGPAAVAADRPKGFGARAVREARDVLAEAWRRRPGEVCVFELLEGLGERLEREPGGGEEDEEDFVHGDGEDHARVTAATGPTAVTVPATAARATSSPRANDQIAPASAKRNQRTTTATGSSADPFTLPSSSSPSALAAAGDGETGGAAAAVLEWTIADPVIEKKSVFQARSCAVSSVEQAQRAVSTLRRSEGGGGGGGGGGKLARATHHIWAYRIKGGDGSGNGDTAAEIVYQDCDDDGETAAGAKVLGVMAAMRVWGVLVVVSRWYGGVKLGPDRFRIIGAAARGVLVMQQQQQHQQQQWQQGHVRGGKERAEEARKTKSNNTHGAASAIGRKGKG